MGLLDLLLPDRCASCGIEETAFCAACQAALLRLQAPLCARCGTPVAWPVERCRECAGRRLAYATARSAVAYEGAAARLVGAWKDGGRRVLASLAAEVTAAALPAPSVEALTFVPAVSERGLWRGYNPSASLARELGVRWALPVRPLLGRRGARRPQRGLAIAERRGNVRGAFTSLARPPTSVGLVDDVYTSGSTVAEAAAVLRDAGAEHVEVVTFARALRERGAVVGDGSRPASSPINIWS